MSSTTSIHQDAPPVDAALRQRIADQLSGQFKGDLIDPEHAGYEPARQVWNAMIDKRPGLILRCTSTEDVVAAVTVARPNRLGPAVRCGGHSVSGKAMSDGGLTVDLSGLRSVEVDPERKLVHAGGGRLLGNVDAATAPHALVVGARAPGGLVLDPPHAEQAGAVPLEHGQLVVDRI